MDHLFAIRGVFAHPVTQWCVGLTIAALVLMPAAIPILGSLGWLNPRRVTGLWKRWRELVVSAPLIGAALVLCAASAMGLMLVISLLCYREFARATGLFRERSLSAIATGAIVLCYLACLDNWYELFVRLQPLTIVAIAVISLLPDRPAGYIQRVSLASIGFLLFGSGLCHLAFVANDTAFRPVLCLIFLGVLSSDALTYAFGRTLSVQRILPNTSPGITIGGRLAAVAVITPTLAFLGSIVFKNTRLDDTAALWLLALLMAVGTQLGELVLSSIKRDIGVKDLATLHPGHGGFADRFNGLLLVAPAAFHVINQYVPLLISRPKQELSTALIAWMSEIWGGV